MSDRRLAAQHQDAGMRFEACDGFPDRADIDIAVEPQRAQQKGHGQHE